MTLSVKHEFVSLKSDGLDTTKVQPSNWNDDHLATAAVDKVLGTDSSSTTVVELSCTAVGRALLAAVDAAAQRAALSVPGLPIGGSFSWHTNTLPVMDGAVEVAWMNGQALSRTTYAALFAILGTTYGAGDASTTFNVPNGCEVALVGRSTMGGVAARGIITHLSNTNVIGTAVGEGRHTQTTAELAQHSHANTLTDPNHFHGITQSPHSHGLPGQPVQDGGANSTVNPGGGTDTRVVSTTLPSDSTDGGSADISINAAATGLSINNVNTGSSTPFNVVQPSLITNFVIRIK